MTRNTENAKICNVIILPILVNMMYLQFFRGFTTKIAFVREFTQSHFSIFFLFCNSSSFTTIAAIGRTIFFFKVFCSRFWKGKFLSTNFTIASHGKHLANRFMCTFLRTTSGLICFKDFRSAKKFFSAYRTNNRNLFCLMSEFAVLGAKKIFMFLCLPKLCFKLFRTMSTVDFHIRHDITRKVLCL